MLRPAKTKDYGEHILQATEKHLNFQRYDGLGTGKEKLKILPCSVAIVHARRSLNERVSARPISHRTNSRDL